MYQLSPSVLVVEDNSQNMSLLCEVRQAHGYQVLQAKNVLCG